MANINTVINGSVFMKKPTIQLGPWIFRPGLISSFSTLLIFPCLVYLGFWQLNRFEQKQHLQQMFERRAQAPPLEPARLTPPHNLSALRYHRLELSGHFLNNHQILLDNQIFQGAVGYRVITPFLPSLKGAKVLLVDRGWIPAEKSRQALPILRPFPEEVRLQGMINLPVHGLLLKAPPLLPNTWPLRVQAIDFQTLAVLLQQPLYPFLLQLDRPAPYQFSKLPVFNQFSADRHLGYAIQWFTMAFVTLIYYLVINSRRINTCQTTQSSLNATG